MTTQRRLGRGLEALLGTPAPQAGGRVERPAGRREPAEAERPPDRREPLPAAAGLRRSRDRPPRREHQGARHAAADRRPPRGRALPAHRRRAAVAGGDQGRAGRSAGPGQQADDREMAELAIVENLQRKDLNALEKAASFQQYLERYDCTQEELAGRLKIDRSTIANLIRLLELPEEVQDAVRKKSITQGHARALLPLGDEREQVKFCQRIQAEGLSVRATEAAVQELVRAADSEPLEAPDDSQPRTVKLRSEHLAALEQDLRTALGTKVDLKHAPGGKGKIVIHFNGHDEFDRIQRQLCCAVEAPDSNGVNQFSRDSKRSAVVSIAIARSSSSRG